MKKMKKEAESVIKKKKSSARHVRNLEGGGVTFTNAGI